MATHEAPPTSPTRRPRARPARSGGAHRAPAGRARTDSTQTDGTRTGETQIPGRHTDDYVARRTGSDTGGTRLPGTTTGGTRIHSAKSRRAQTREARDTWVGGPARIRGNPWLSLISVALGVIMVGLDATVVPIANPFIARDLHASLPDLQWVTNAYLLTLAVLLIPAGKLGDRFGRRLMFLIGVVGFAFASLGVGLVGGITGVIALRALQGAFGALLMPNTLAILRATFPPEKLNTAVGIWGGASALSIAAGPIVGGELVEQASWQSVFYVNLPVGAVALAVGLVVLRESRDTEGRHSLDPAGLLTLSGGLFSLVFGLVKAQAWGWGDPRTLGLLGGAAALLALFVLAEAAAEATDEAPLVPLRLLRNRSLSISMLAVGLTFFGLMGVLFFVTLYLQNVHGYTPVGAGTCLLPLTAVVVIASPLGSALTARFGPRTPIVGGMTLLACGLSGLASLAPRSPYLHLWPSFAAIGLGVGFVMVAGSDAIVGNAPVADAGVAGGLQSTAVQLGGVLGTAILGTVLSTRVNGVLADRLAGAGVPASLTARLTPGEPFVVQGLAAPGAPAGTPPDVRQAIVDGSHAAFLSGLHVAMAVAAAVAIGAALLALSVRRGDNAGEQLSPA
jgi:EmrB/QacA subfamily drug resistance transporter